MSKQCFCSDKCKYSVADINNAVHDRKVRLLVNLLKAPHVISHARQSQLCHKYATPSQISHFLFAHGRSLSCNVTAASQTCKFNFCVPTPKIKALRVMYTLVKDLLKAGTYSHTKQSLCVDGYRTRLF